MVVGDGLVREAGHSVGREDLALGAVDANKRLVAPALLVLRVHFLARVELDPGTRDLGVGHEVSIPREPGLAEGDGIEQLHGDQPVVVGRESGQRLRFKRGRRCEKFMEAARQRRARP